MNFLGKPSGVRDIRTIKETATTITFEFEEPIDKGGLPIRAFIVEYYEENEPYDDARMYEWSEGILIFLV